MIDVTERARQSEVRRFPRKGVWLAFVPVLALAPLLAMLLLESGPRSPERAPTSIEVAPGPQEAPPPGPAERALATARDPAAPLGERTLAIKRYTQESKDPGPLLALIDARPGDPKRAQVRATALSALVRFPHDRRARDRILRALRLPTPRHERLQAMSILATWPGGASWARPALRRLSTDADPSMRQKAAWALSRIPKERP